MIAYYLLASAVLTVLVIMIGYRHKTIKIERNLSNARVCAIHRAAGNRWYPHVMDDGTVRWYPVLHDYALDI